jgi:hypothetical protein
MSREQWMLLGAFLGVVGVQVGTLHHWNEAITPAFLGGVLVQAAILIRGFFTEKPASETERIIRNYRGR